MPEDPQDGRSRIECRAASWYPRGAPGRDPLKNGNHDGTGVRFDRHELAGSFGDIGTDLPLIVGIVLATGLDAGGVFVVFGVLQILTGLVYGLPMPMQPLKAMAVLVITQKIGGGVLLGAGLAIGAVMLVLTLTGALERLAVWIPRPVVRGVQFGLGLSLAGVALGKYVPADGPSGYAVAAVGAVVVLALWRNRRFPAALVVVAVGALYAIASGVRFGTIADGIGLTLPRFAVPAWDDVLTGFVVLAIPQLPLSVSNSVIATEQTLRDLFPRARVGVRKIGLTYSAVNLIAPLFGGIPACHGCGGIAGHHTFGARTGGSVILYGSFYVAIGLLLSEPLHEVVKLFPQPILGVILLFEALALLSFVRDQAAVPRDLSIALLVGVVAMTVPYGFAVGLVLGLVVYHGFRRFGTVRDDPDAGPGTSQEG